MGRHERYVPQGTAENPLLIWVRPGLGIAGPVPALFSVRRFRSRTLHRTPDVWQIARWLDIVGLGFAAAATVDFAHDQRLPNAWRLRGGPVR